MQSLLTPAIVMIVQKAADHLPAVLASVRGRGSPITGIGLPSTAAECDMMKACWSQIDDIPLIIFRPERGSALADAVGAVCLIHEKRPNQPLAVVYANHELDPESTELRESLALKLSDSIMDLQQLEYSPSWRKSPPRIR